MIAMKAMCRWNWRPMPNLLKCKRRLRPFFIPTQTQRTRSLCIKPIAGCVMVPGEGETQLRKQESPSIRQFRSATGLRLLNYPGIEGIGMCVLMVDLDKRMTG